MRLALKESALSLRGRTAKFTWPIKLNPGAIYVIQGSHLVNHLQFSREYQEVFSLASYNSARGRLALGTKA